MFEPLAATPRLQRALAALAIACTSACSQHGGGSDDATAGNRPTGLGLASDAAATRIDANEPSDAAAIATRRDARTARGVMPPLPANFVPPAQVLALGTWVPIRREPRRDAPLAGYMRAGAIADLEGMPAGRETCPVHADHPEGGWYRLRGGGFVCVGGALAIPWPARSVRRPVQPSFDAGNGLPYTYAINYGRSNLYRSLPTEDDLRLYEPWRFRHDDDAAAAAGDPSTVGRAGSSDTPSNSDAGSTRSGSREGSSTGSNATASTSAATSATTASGDSPTTTPDGRPTLRDLRGDPNSPVIRRLLSGMYVALDRLLPNHDTGERYWRTQTGGFLRNGPVSELHRVSTFEGVELDAARTLPYAFMVSLTGWDYRVSPTGRGVIAHHRVPRFTAFQLSTEPPIEQGANRYLRTVDGMAVQERNVRVATLRAPPEDVGPTGHWFDIDVDQQILVAYEGTAPRFVTLVSTGRRGPRDNREEYETPVGHFRIRGKHITTTMDGDTAADGPYSIEDVPWAMYFHENYALHGAFWHGNFGWRMSHGCVNLSPADARRMFFFAEPAIPDGWHGVFATPERPGSVVVVHHTGQPAPRRPGH